VRTAWPGHDVIYLALARDHGDEDVCLRGNLCRRVGPPRPAAEHRALEFRAGIPRGDLIASEDEIGAHWQAHPSHADEPGTHYWLSMLRSVPALRTAWASPSLLKYTNTPFPICCHSRIRAAHHIRLP
jgi:hypothetical protein